MRNAVVTALAALFVLGVTPDPAAAQDRAVQVYVEPLLVDILARSFPGYVLVPVEDMDPAIQRLAEQDPAYAANDHSPAAIRADFDGNGVADYAVLVRERDSDAPDEIFAVLMGQGHGQYLLAAQAFFGAILNTVYLGYAPAGAVLSPAPGSTVVREPVELAQPAVTLNYMGGAATAFYWDPLTGRLLSMPTGK